MFINGELRFLKKNLREKDIIFDVGANIGEWTRFVLNFNENIVIHCFEPSSKTFNLLMKNYFPINVICNNLGLSSQETEQELYSIKEGSGIGSLYKRIRFFKKNTTDSKILTERVRLDTLDNYCKKKNIDFISYLKIDVEGHEYEVFKGGKNLFKNSQINIIQFEYGGSFIDSHVFLKDIFDYFKDFDYNFYKIFPNSIKQVKSYNAKHENFQYQNWLIIKKDYKFNP